MLSPFKTNFSFDSDTFGYPQPVLPITINILHIIHVFLNHKDT